MSFSRNVPVMKNPVWRYPLYSLWADPWTDFPLISRLFEQNFCVPPLEDVFNPYRSGLYYRRHQISSSQSGISEVTHDDKEFRVRLDVNHFSPEEITVKTVENRVLIHAKHEEKQDEHGFIQREFTRQYLLPRECDTNNVISALSSDGILTIRAPKTLPANGNERVIPITQEIAKT